MEPEFIEKEGDIATSNPILVGDEKPRYHRYSVGNMLLPSLLSCVRVKRVKVKFV